MIEPPSAAVRVTNPGDLADFYSDEPGAHIYALVDLEEPFWSGSQWFRRDDAVVGLVGMPTGQGMAVYAVSTKDPDGSLALLVELAPQLPAGQLMTGPIGLARALRSTRAVRWEGPHLRYVLTNSNRVPSASAQVRPLGRDGLAELTALYASDPGAAFFLPHMVDDASFVGVFDEGTLVAAAGTHVLSEAQRVAAIGAVYTRPSHRGRGLGKAVTVGAIHRIADRVDLIGLNVAVDNLSARRIYESIGFTPVLEYDEAELA